MTRFFYLFLIAVTGISCNAKNKTVKDPDKVRIDAVCDKFMAAFKDGKVTEAMQLLRENCVLISSTTVDTLEMQISQQIKEGVFAQYGEVISYELVTERKVKDFALKKYYVLRFKKFYLKFVFSLYNGGSGWKITGFKYDEEVSELF